MQMNQIASMRFRTSNWCELHKCFSHKFSTITYSAPEFPSCRMMTRKLQVSKMKLKATSIMVTLGKTLHVNLLIAHSSDMFIMSADIFLFGSEETPPESIAADELDVDIEGASLDEADFELEDDNVF